MKNTPIESITVKCSECGDEVSGEHLLKGRVRMHLPDNTGVSWPKTLTDEQIKEIPSKGLICECCQEDKDEMESDR